MPPLPGGLIMKITICYLSSFVNNTIGFLLHDLGSTNKKADSKKVGFRTAIFF